MNFLEKDLEQIIYETPNEFLRARGMSISGVKKRQIKVGHYGIIDIVSVSTIPHVDTFLFNILELKKKKIDANALMQAYRYRKGLESFFDKKKFMNSNIDFKITLVGQEICLGDFAYMQDYLSDVEIFLYSYKHDGIYFKRPGSYTLIEEGF